MSRHEHDRGRDRAGAGARRDRASEGTHCAVAGVDHRLAQPGRPAQAEGLRHRAAASRERPPRAVWRADGAVPAMRIRRHRTALRIRLHLLQGVMALQELPRAVRLLQVPLKMAAIPRFHRLAINDLRRETADAISLTFAIPGELASEYRFVPGQYLTL